ncbi:hypothetical protein [Segatella baroniae]|uniref:hypothetical protein n=1 Tax=Segatella baroniae TaxID=305719 RepID=UPI000683DB6C|nr:hypothetical protein [Segatella baroniae]
MPIFQAEQVVGVLCGQFIEMELVAAHLHERGLIVLLIHVGGVVLLHAFIGQTLGIEQRAVGCVVEKGRVEHGDGAPASCRLMWVWASSSLWAENEPMRMLSPT